MSQLEKALPFRSFNFRGETDSCLKKERELFTVYYASSKEKDVITLY